jgi:hypothetical protein
MRGWNLTFYLLRRHEDTQAAEGEFAIVGGGWRLFAVVEETTGYDGQRHAEPSTIVNGPEGAGFYVD